MKTLDLPVEDMLPRVIYAREFELGMEEAKKSRRTANSYELGFYLEGNGTIVIEDEEYPVHYGDVRFTKPGTHLFSLPHYKCYTLVFDFGQINTLCRNQVLDQIPSYFSTDGEARFLFEAIIKSFQSNDGIEKLRCNALVMELICELHEACRFRSNYSGAVRTCIRYMEEHFGENITLQDLGEITGYSHIHTMRLFRKETGQTPKEWLTGLRINRAKELLSMGGRTMEEIAEKCGFRSPSHFKVLFKEKTGFTPGAYRKNTGQIY